MGGGDIGCDSRSGTILKIEQQWLPVQYVLLFLVLVVNSNWNFIELHVLTLVTHSYVLLSLDMTPQLSDTNTCSIVIYLVLASYPGRGT